MSKLFHNYSDTLHDSGTHGFAFKSTELADADIVPRDAIASLLKDFCRNDCAKSNELAGRSLHGETPKGEALLNKLQDDTTHSRATSSPYTT